MKKKKGKKKDVRKTTLGSLALRISFKQLEKRFVEALHQRNKSKKNNVWLFFICSCNNLLVSAEFKHVIS
jgi:hypothetical protein